MPQGFLNEGNPFQILQGYFSKTSPNLLWFYEADTSYEVIVQEETKAFARLGRGLWYPVISAMSGYSQGNRADVLSNEISTEKVRKLCQIINYNISRSFVSHVEKQPIAYYIDRHWIFDQDGCATADSNGLESLRDVLPIPPPAIIKVNKEPMRSDCLAFYNKIRTRFEKF